MKTTSRMTAMPRLVSVGALAFTVAAALTLTPVLTGGSLCGDKAFAHPGNGNGGGNGNGNGGGNGNGNGGGNGNGDGDGNGNGHAAAGPGTGVGASVGAASASTGSPSSQGSIASMLGALNAAHASKTALSHAHPTSRVGRIAAYSRAVSAAEHSVDVAEANLAAARAALAKDPTNPSLQMAVTQDQANLAAARRTLSRTEFTFARAASNKSVTPTVISALNGLLGIR
ncbi:MAG TPA: hypothetical protein VKG91_04190 [Roseiarcus sp.]|nr:hypothetical protein [Roseiarcus sp.]